MKKQFLFIILVLASLLHTYALTADTTDYDDRFEDWTETQYTQYEDSILNILYPSCTIQSLDETNDRSNNSTGEDKPIISSYSKIPKNVSPDTSMEVGEIAIISGTSKTGAKTYEIPIEVTSGINDLQPSISLSYNSQQGNSILGYGWNLSGIPMISRGGNSVYYDGSARGIAMDNDDSFYLDGLRLIRIETGDTYNIYESVYGNIKVKGHISGGSITYFVVYYPDGNRGVFGSSTSDNRLYYPILSLTDLFGNSITYQYTKEDNHYRINKISYNNGRSIQFQYDYRADPLLWYAGGKKIYENQILQSIIHKSGTNEICTYNLGYSTRNNVSLLTQIELSSSGKSYNPLIFYYGDDQSSSEYDISTTQLLEWYAYEQPQSVVVSKGKFDYGSGADGLIVYPNKNPYWKHFRHKGTFNHSENQFKNLYSGTERIFLYSRLTDDVALPMPEILTEDGFVDILCADLEGNQEEYIVKINNLVESGLDVVKINVYRAGTPGFLPKIYSRSYSFNTVYTDKSGGKSIQPKYYYTGDFDGDGKMEILAVSVHEPFGDTSKPSMCFVFDPINDKILYSGHLLDFNLEFLGTQQSDTDYVTNHSDRLFVFDYDGDGKADICHINTGGTDIYTFNVSENTLTAHKVASSAEPGIYNLFYKDIYPGEYNGDGMMDILVSKSSPPGSDVEWTLYNSMGNGLFDKSTFDGPSRATADYHGLIIQDINNDGKTDLIEYRPNGFNTYLTDKNRIPVTYFYTGYENDKPIFVPSDINTRNSFIQLLGLNGGVVTRFSFRRDDSKDLLAIGMTNSLGVTETTSYMALTDECDTDSFYTIGFDAIYPYINISEPLPVVRCSEKYLDGELIDRQVFSYSNAVLHRQGLGFCGFSKITTTDMWDETVVRTFDPYKYCNLLRETSSTHDNIYSYSVNISSDKIVKLRLDSKQESDLLKGISSTTTFSYDAYGYPTGENTTYSDGITINTTKSYSSQPAVADGYNLGLLREQITTVTGINDSFTERMVIPSTVQRKPSMICRYTNNNQTEMIQNAYDSHGNLISNTVKPYTSGKSLTTTYTYDTYGHVSAITDPFGLTTEYTYDLHGNPLTVIDRRVGQTRYIYDDFGRETTVIYPDGTIGNTTYSWISDISGGIYSINLIDPNGSDHTTTYDALGRKIRVSDIRFDGKARNIDMAYDLRGNLTKESLPFFGDTPTYWNTYTYDQYDRIIQQTDASGRIQTYTYNGTEITTVTDGVSVSHDYNSQGNLTSVEDPTGVITYDLRADGQPASMASQGNIVTSFTYDALGRRIMTDDPSHGRTIRTYDTSGNVASETDANGKTKEYVYDTFNRLIRVYTPEFTVNYTYDLYGKIAAVYATNGTSTVYTYDGLGRIVTEEENAPDGVWLTKDFTYSSGNINSIKYTSAYGTLVTETYLYTYGHLREVRDDDGDIIFKLISENALGQPLRIQTGDITRDYVFSPFGLPTGRSATISSTTIQNYSYVFDRTKSNLLLRADNTRQKAEDFSYDQLNRLTNYGDDFAAYDGYGNIRMRSDIGIFSYGHPTKPYAITGASLYDEYIPSAEQHISYSSFSRPLYISENTTEVQFTYNGDYERVKMETFVDGISKKKKYYLGGCYEFETGSVIPKESLYLNGGYYDSPAVFVRYKYPALTNDSISLGDFSNINSSVATTPSSTNSNDVYIPRIPATYYILRDYLGSITHVLRSDGAIVGEYSYDAWGRLRDPATFRPYSPGNEPTLFLGRGYTGHEYLTDFGLINMNARLYDPALGRFLSPDPWIQLPDMSQNLNRYTYAMNNPLCYVDENGEFFWFAIGAAALFGAVTNVAVHWKQIKATGGGWKGFWKGASYALAGAAAGAAGTAAAFGVGSMLGAYGVSVSLSSSGIMAGAINGASDGLVSGFMLGTSNSLLEGNSFANSLNVGAVEGFSGFAFGALSGGVVGGFNAYKEGANLWKGSKLNTSRGSPIEADDYLSKYNQNDGKSHYIYGGFEKGTNNILYIGRTTREPEIRFSEHLRSNTKNAFLEYRILKVVENGLLERIWEQRYINKYGMLRNGGVLYNRINGISPKYWKKYDIKP